MPHFLAAVEIVILTFGLVFGSKSHNLLHRKASSKTTPRPRIVNGDEADPASFPWFAVGYGFTCGAALIHPDILVTAAHCQGVFPSGLTMTDKDGQEFHRDVQFDQQVRHKNFNEFSEFGIAKSDIMLLKLSEPIYDVTPIVWNTNEASPDSEEVLTVLGHGRTETEGSSSHALLKADMVYIDNNKCRTIVEGHCEEDLPPWYDCAELASIVIDNGVLCTNPIEDIEAATCFGDSGGPLFTQDDPPLLVGIVSFLIEDCESGYPDMFTRISTFDRWIRQQICRMSVDTPNYCDEYPPDPVPDSYIYNMALEFTYDEKPWQTTFAIRRFLSNGDTNILFSGPTYVPNPGETWTSEFMLPAGNFSLEIYDLVGDGLSNSAWFRLNYTLANAAEIRGSFIPEDLEFEEFEDIWRSSVFTLDKVIAWSPSDFDIDLYSDYANNGDSLGKGDSGN